MIKWYGPVAAKHGRIMYDDVASTNVVDLYNLPR